MPRGSSARCGCCCSAPAPRSPCGPPSRCERHATRRAQSWDPDNVAIAGELGFVLSRQDKDAEAIAPHDAAIEHGGANHLLRFNHANCLLRRRRFTQAAFDLRVCLEIDPGWHEARINLTSVLVAAGDREAARAELAHLERRGGPAHAILALHQLLGDAPWSTNARSQLVTPRCWRER